MRPNNSCKRDHTYCCSSNRAKIKLICQQLVAPKIEFHQTLLQKTNWYSVVSPIKPNQRYILILNKWRYNDHEKRIIFQRGLLDWLLPIWTLPSVCEIRDKMQVVLNCMKSSLSHAFNSMWFFFSGVGQCRWNMRWLITYEVKIVLQTNLNH